MKVPLVIRMIIGRGWGQGPQHSQSLHAWFAHIPGLKVVMPSTAYDAKGMLLAAVNDNNPVIFLEHRWLHNTIGNVCHGDERVPLGKANIAKFGDDITIVAMSYMTVEALHAANYLRDNNVSCEVIDLRTIKPLDWKAVLDSVAKTGRLLALDTGFTTGSVAGEIVARVAIEKFDCLKSAPARLAMPDVPEPTSSELTKGFYIRAADICIKVVDMLGKDASLVKEELLEPTPHDVPGHWFKGPF
jgi:pyruvate dehydrogenase E1 component beta subunit